MYLLTPILFGLLGVLSWAMFWAGALPEVLSFTISPGAFVAFALIQGQEPLALIFAVGALVQFAAYLFYGMIIAILLAVSGLLG